MVDTPRDTPPPPPPPSDSDRDSENENENENENDTPPRIPPTSSCVLLREHVYKALVQLTLGTRNNNNSYRRRSSPGRRRYEEEEEEGLHHLGPVPEGLELLREWCMSHPTLVSRVFLTLFTTRYPADERAMNLVASWLPPRVTRRLTKHEVLKQEPSGVPKLRGLVEWATQWQQQEEQQQQQQRDEDEDEDATRDKNTTTRTRTRRDAFDLYLVRMVSEEEKEVSPNHQQQQHNSSSKSALDRHGKDREDDLVLGFLSGENARMRRKLRLAPAPCSRLLPSMVACEEHRQRDYFDAVREMKRRAENLLFPEKEEEEALPLFVYPQFLAEETLTKASHTKLVLHDLVCLGLRVPYPFFCNILVRLGAVVHCSPGWSTHSSAREYFAALLLRKARSCGRGANSNKVRLSLLLLLVVLDPRNGDLLGHTEGGGGGGGDAFIEKLGDEVRCWEEQAAAFHEGHEEEDTSTTTTVEAYHRVMANLKRKIDSLGRKN